MLRDQVDLSREADEIDCSGDQTADLPKLSSGQVSEVCGSKQYCKEMGSCEKEKSLTQYELTGLDWNKNGIP